MAPRVHNSGHWTIEGADTSQFENHLRAVCGLPLGSPTAIWWSAMYNFIGTVPPAADVLTHPRTHFHHYGKPARAGRKVGHVTVRFDSPDEMRERLVVLDAAFDRKE
jgi:5-(carboxyamino)imidazole ribonucleotide synthase